MKLDMWHMNKMKRSLNVSLESFNIKLDQIEKRKLLSQRENSEESLRNLEHTVSQSNDPIRNV